LSEGARNHSPPEERDEAPPAQLEAAIARLLASWRLLGVLSAYLDLLPDAVVAAWHDALLPSDAATLDSTHIENGVLEEARRELAAALCMLRGAGAPGAAGDRRTRVLLALELAARLNLPVRHSAIARV